MTKILLISVPFMEPEMPAPAVFHLKGQLNQHNITSMAIDINVLLYRAMIDKWNEVANLLQGIEHLNWYKEDLILNEEIENNLCRLVDIELKKYNPEWIGLSVFTINSRHSTINIIKYIRKNYPAIKIVIGGAGLGKSLGDYEYSWAQELLNDNLIDYFISGEGEIALVKLLQDVIDYPGINSDPKQIEDLTTIAWADYTDTDNSLYPWEKYNISPTYVLTGSRGCVRRCDFCDVYKFWPKYRYRTGDDIAKEMLHNYKNKNVDHFYFSDSLINGSMKSFRELYTILKDYKDKKLLPNNINWGGQFIARTNSQMSPNDYKLAKESGFIHCSIGLEHASEKIRVAMNKGFTNVALNDTVKNLAEAGIYAAYNFIIGHPLETEEDFKEILEFLHKYKWANDMKIVDKINLQTGIYFLEGTDFYSKKDSLVENEPFNCGDEYWISKHVPNLNFPEIYKRRMRVSETAKKLGYKLHDEENLLVFMNTKLKRYNKLKEQYETQ